jgi:hypothetical protein
MLSSAPIEAYCSSRLSRHSVEALGGGRCSGYEPITLRKSCRRPGVIFRSVIYPLMSCFCLIDQFVARS